MNASEWRLHEELTVKFSKIIYLLKFPEVLGDPPITEGEQADRIRRYFYSDPVAYHTLRALVRTAVDAALKAMPVEEPNEHS